MGKGCCLFSIIAPSKDTELSQSSGTNFDIYQQNKLNVDNSAKFGHTQQSFFPLAQSARLFNIFPSYQINFEFRSIFHGVICTLSYRFAVVVLQKMIIFISSLCCTSRTCNIVNYSKYSLENMQKF
ncbi:hypothetical protein Tsp_10350 [Trichinella spiralis]|uniref:hypothetical protein n=1 Tax=Trichinella spiralis TaxID=6334 RepID=UPI0001EFE546|nr:hypothetical protein Tsp_10350 [Trichinella spiralis]